MTSPVSVPAQPTGSAHILDIRVYYEDTDAGGVVYHARYLAFAERARTEMLRAAGVPHEEMVQDEGLIFVVRRVKMDYLRPALLDQVVRVATTPTAMGAATADLHQAFSVAGVPVGRLDVQLACVRRADGRPARIPARWRGAFTTAQSRRAFTTAQARPALDEVSSGSDG